MCSNWSRRANAARRPDELEQLAENLDAGSHPDLLEQPAEDEI